MNSILLYILKSTVCMSMLYLIFRLLMRKETSFRVNRLTLLLIVSASLVIPFFEMPQTIQTSVQVNLISEFTENRIPVQDNPISEETNPQKLQFQPETLPESKNPVIPIEIILRYIYLTGVLIAFVLLIRNICLVLKLFRKARVIQKEGFRILIVDCDVPSFAFGRSIVIPQDDFDLHGSAIIAHEQAHIRLNHFYDLVLLEVVKILHWFNPVIYALIRDLKDIHEFQADNNTLTSGIDATKYKLLIIQKGVGLQKFTLANSFNHCQIKKRIVMMNKLKTGKAWRWKVAAFLPVLALLLMAFGRMGENAPPEKEILSSVVFLPQDAVKQWTEADFKELTIGNLRDQLAKMTENHSIPSHLINIHIDQKSKISVNTRINVWEAMNLDEINSLIGKSWTYNEKRKKMIPIPIILISKDSSTTQNDYLKLLNVAANSILQVRESYSKKFFNLAYPELTTIQRNEIDMLIPINVFYSRTKLEMIPAPAPQLSQVKFTPPLFIDIKQEGIFFMKKLVTLDEFRKEFPFAIKNNPQSEVWVDVSDSNNSDLPAVKEFLKKYEDDSKVKYYRQTIKFAPPEISDIKMSKRNTFSMQVDSKGKVFVGFDGQDNRRKLLTRMGEIYNIVFSPKELEEFTKIDSFGVPMNRMKAFLNMPDEEKQSENAIGIPYDSGNNEFKNWVRTARTVDREMRIDIKGDPAVSYQVIKKLIDQLQDLHENRYNLLVPESVKASEIAFPSKTGGPEKFSQSSVLDYVRNKPRVVTIIPDKDNSIYYYLGTQDAKGNNPVLTKTDYSPSGIHDLLINMNYDALTKVEDLSKKKENRELSEEDFEKQRLEIISDKTAVIVLIKPTDASAYGSLMNILDEIKACSIGRYAIIDLSDYDKELIKKARL